MNEEEEQAYKDQLKRIGKKIADDINDELKKNNLIEHTYPNFAGELNTEGYERRYALCLLYTSPSPRDLSTSRMPSSA